MSYISASFPVESMISRVPRVWSLADVYRPFFGAWKLGMVVRLLSQDGPFATTTTAFDDWGTSSSQFPLDTRTQFGNRLWF